MITLKFHLIYSSDFYNSTKFASIITLKLDQIDGVTITLKVYKFALIITTQFSKMDLDEYHNMLQKALSNYKIAQQE